MPLPRLIQPVRAEVRHRAGRGGADQRPRRARGTTEDARRAAADVAIGEHCTTPHDCPFIERCWPSSPITTSANCTGSSATSGSELEATVYATIYDLPSDLELSLIHARQVKACRPGDGGGGLRSRRHWAQSGRRSRFSISNVSLAIHDGRGAGRGSRCRCSSAPMLRGGAADLSIISGSRRGKRIRDRHSPRQWSRCARGRAGRAYHASFERECIKRWGGAPHLDKELERIEKALVDLLPAIRRHVYHPDFGGRVQYQETLPALCRDCPTRI